MTDRPTHWLRRPLIGRGGQGCQSVPRHGAENKHHRSDLLKDIHACGRGSADPASRVEPLWIFPRHASAATLPLNVLCIFEKSFFHWPACLMDAEMWICARWWHVRMSANDSRGRKWCDNKTMIGANGAKNTSCELLLVDSGSFTDVDHGTWLGPLLAGGTSFYSSPPPRAGQGVVFESIILGLV